MKPTDSYGNKPSDEAWTAFHRKLAEMNLKHGHKLIAKEEKGA